MNHAPEKTIAHIRWLIWLYFVLLIIEGALRKWVVPGLSNPLLLVRDPVVVAIYLLAFRAQIFPWNRWVVGLGVIGLLTVLVSIVQLAPYIDAQRIALVTGYGFRCNFLHLPLIFVMERVLRREDVKRIGWATLLILVPMTVLMVAQFRASPDAFLNRTTGGEGEMMQSALGKVRTAGPFSFVIGVVAYFALSTGFLIWAALRRDVYKNWLLFAAGSALVIGIVVSGSRSVVGACAVVVASLAVVLFLRPSAVNRFGQTLVVTVILGLILSRTPIFKEGLNVLTTRFAEVAEATETSVGAGLVERVVSDFADGFHVLTKAPFLGYGLGIGTNAGARFLTGKSMFLLAEGEWSRLFLESGPVLGLAFVLWRFGLVVAIGWLCLRSVQQGNVLPLLLYSASFLPMINGQFGQPTVLGFSVFTMGLVLGARHEEEAADDNSLGEVFAGKPGARLRMPGRSAYAARLHGPPTEPVAPPSPPTPRNGSADR